jgi:hypothetical protein
MIPDHPHTIDKREILDLLSTSIHGLEEVAGAIFIFAVLLVNSIIGTIQEYSAQRSSITST